MGLIDDSLDKGSEAEIANRFIQQLKLGEKPFFDLDTFEVLYDHFMEKGDLTMAHEVCRQALVFYPYSTDFQYNLAMLLYQTGKYESALPFIEKVGVLQPTNFEVQLLRSVLNAHSGNLPKAIQILEDVLPFATEKEKALNALGEYFIRIKQNAKGIEYFKQSLLINSKQDAIFEELISLLERLGEVKEHLNFFQQMVDTDPFSSKAWFYLGSCLNKVKEYEKAKDALDYALALDEAMADAWFNKACALMNMKQHSEALECLQTCKKLEEPNAETELYLGACYEELGNLDRAAQHYKKSITLDQSFDDAWYGLGSCMLKLDKFLEAIHYFSKAIDQDNRIAAYWMGLAKAEYMMGNLISSSEAYDRAANLEPKIVELWLDWSFMYYDAGDYDRAINLITEGIEELPTEAELHYRAVVYFIAAGLYREALAYLENALILDFDRHTLLFDFFEDLEKQKMLFKIIEQYRTRNA